MLSGTCEFAIPAELRCIIIDRKEWTRPLNIASHRSVQRLTDPRDSAFDKWARKWWHLEFVPGGPVSRLGG